MSTLTPSNNPESLTLFSIANRLYREGFYEDAILIYEFLVESDPTFPCYAYNDMLARKSLKRQNKEIKLGSKFHLGNATSYQKRLRIADRLSKFNDSRLIEVAFGSGPRDVQYWLAQASAAVPSDYAAWLNFVNRYLKEYGFSALALKPTSEWKNPELFLNLCATEIPAVDGPPVTVCMSCFNAEAYVELAVRSLLNQSYTNLELFLFNDKSSDGTLKILRRLEEEDKRIMVIDNENNQGTYISRNQAFQRAKGEFFTIMDADDFALSERIALQVNHLAKNPDHMGVMTEWVRMNTDGRFHFKSGWGGVYQHEAVATLMVRTHEVREKIGYWDSVRFAADTEFQVRLQKVYGKQAIKLLEVPTVISLFHEASLTNDPVTGISVGGIRGLSPTRLKYRDSWGEWHKEGGNDLYLPFPLKNRLFDAPSEMLPNFS